MNFMRNEMTTEKNNLDIQTFLEKIAVISVKHSGVSKKEQLNFNVFSILRRETEEVGLHSAFLFALLDPKGAHEHQTIFLNSLMDVLGLSDFTDAKFERSGKEIPFDNGRIDLYFQQGDRALIIENKIDANDEPEQLSRYIKVAKDEFKAKHIDVVYLTLDGKIPTLNSLGDYGHLLDGLCTEGGLRTEDGVQLKCASYKSDIVKWLEHCIAKMALYPTTRETLVLYKRLVLGLTGQSLMEAEKMEIVNTIVQNKENLEAALKVMKVSDDLKKKILTSAIGKIVAEVTKQGYEIVENTLEGEPLVREAYLTFKKANSDWKGFTVQLQPQGSDGGNVKYGIKNPVYEHGAPIKGNESIEALKKEISEKKPNCNLSNECWLCIKALPDPYKNLTSREALTKLQFENGVDVINKDLLKIAEEFDEVIRKL